MSVDASRTIRYRSALEFAERQVAALVHRQPDFFPIYTVQGRWRHAGELGTDWTGGFLAGMMWGEYFFVEALSKCLENG